MGLIRSYLWPDFDDNGNALLAARKRLTHVMCLLSGTIMGFYAYGELVVIVQNDVSYSSLIPYLLTPPVLFVLAGLVAKDMFVRGALAFQRMNFRVLRTGFFVPAHHTGLKVQASACSCPGGSYQTMADRFRSQASRASGQK